MKQIYLTKISPYFAVVKNNYLFFVIILMYGFLHLASMGQVSPTFDEETDLTIVDCYATSKNIFGCTDDISQARLPHYLHSIVQIAFHTKTDSTIHYWLSFVIGLLNIGIIFVFASKEFGKKIAYTTLLLMVTSNSLLASSRMILTHSNILFAFITTLLFIQLYYFYMTKKIYHFFWTIIFAGLSTSASILGFFNLIPIFFVSAHHLQNATKNRKIFIRALLVSPIIFISCFLLASPMYLNYQNFLKLIVDLSNDRGHAYLFWNYLGSESFSAPWWYSYFLFMIKITPWVFGIWIFTPKLLGTYVNKKQRQFLILFFLSFLTYLTVKSFLFAYDAPHHHIQFFSFVYLTIAINLQSVIAKITEKFVFFGSVIIIAFFLFHSIDTLRFFPQFLFYGAQYGERLIGEFYGPAVLHCYDQNSINHQIKMLIKNKKFIVHADQSCIRMESEYLIPFSQEERLTQDFFAYVDYLHAKHFNYPKKDDYNQYVRTHCSIIYTYYFPTHIPVYQLYKCRK